MTLLWLGLFLAFLIIEGIVVGLVTIWFAAGALMALVVTLLGGQLWLQITVFCVVSAACIILLRPMTKRWMRSKQQPTNADRLLQMTGVVQEEIENLTARGLVKIDGKEWTARSETGERIPAGAVVRPLRIEGVKLIVEPVNQENKEEQT